ncbi:uncharacterized protein LOC122079124 [Macadamia integrifolia]|uniref:uncharacterized protein LOC122079124 n=1 Tax=Macadamia integrifolia TaxID=60698 RepID=UPI001C4FC9BB|nr:uncharacterized protein LOC122079124 [Macadamia integrifolia]
MVQVQQQQKYSNSNSAGGGGGGGNGGGSGGGRSSKKLKQKKIPQRGLGVAQLEKIRLEEQQKKDATADMSSPSFVLPIPLPQHQHSSSSSPFPATPTDLSSTSSVFRTLSQGPVLTLDLLAPPHPPPPFQTIATIYVPCQGGSTCGPIADVVNTFTGEGHYSRMWSNGLNYNGDVPILDHGLAYRAQLQNEASYPIWHSPPPVPIDRNQPHSSIMGIVPSFPMELPSNQSICSSNNNCTALQPPPWPEEEKMVGIKRPCPFSLDNLPLASSLRKIPPFIQPLYRAEEPSLSGISVIGQSTISELKHRIVEGNYLTLGPPATSSSSMGCKYNKQQPLAASTPSHYPILEFGLNSSLASIEEPAIHNFFPTKGKISRVATTTNDQRRVKEYSDTVDLNLKL